MEVCGRVACHAVHGPAIGDVTWEIVAYAVLSLTIVRMIPVALAMIGSGLQPQSVLFLGWFGPRASIVLTGVVVEGSQLPGMETIVTVAMVTVGISVFIHGVTSWYGSESYADWSERNEAENPDAAEAESVSAVNVPHRFRSPGVPAQKRSGCSLRSSCTNRSRTT